MNYVNSFHLGDCIWHLMFLRKLGGIHTLHCNEEYHKELRDLTEGTQIALGSLSSLPDGVLDCWINLSNFGCGKILKVQ